MNRLKILLISLVSLGGSSFIPSSLCAQGELHIGGHATALLPAERLNVEDLFGYGAALSYKPSRFIRFGLSFSRYNDGHYKAPEGGERDLSAWSSSLDLEGTVVGENSRLFAVVSPTLYSFSLAEIPGAAGVSKKVPALGAGLGLSLGLGKFVALEISAKDMMSWTRNDPFLSSEGTRKISHSPEVKAQFTLRFKRRDRVAQFEEYPAEFTDKFQPVTASQVQTPELKGTSGREHLHINDNLERVLSPPYDAVATVEGSVLGTIFFEEGSFDIPDEYQRVVRNVSDYLRRNPDVMVRIKGYTSPPGSIQYNLSLAERRAAAIRNQLVYYYQLPQERIEATTGGIDPEPKSLGHAQRAEVVELVIKKP